MKTRGWAGREERWRGSRARLGLGWSGAPRCPLTSGCCLRFWTRGRRRRFWRLSLAEFKPRPMTSHTSVPGAVEAQPLPSLRSAPLPQLPLINPGRPAWAPCLCVPFPKPVQPARGRSWHTGCPAWGGRWTGRPASGPHSINSQSRKVMLPVQLLQLLAALLPARACASTFLALFISSARGRIVHVLILYTRNLGLREMKCLVQGHTVK